MSNASRAWLLAFAWIALVLGFCYHEALTGSAAIDGASLLPYEDALFGGPRQAPAPTFDPSGETQHQPWDTAIMAAFRQGQLPLWLPGAGAGAPLLGNGQSAPFFPLKALFLLGSGAVGVPLAWYLVSRQLLAGAGMLLLARRLGWPPAVGAIGALAFMLNGYAAYRLRLPDATEALLLPWVLLAALRFLERPDRRGVALLGGMIGFLGLAGHPEGALFMAAGGMAVVVAGLVRERAPARAWGALAGAMLLAAGVAGIAVVPFLAVVRDSHSYLLNRQQNGFGEFEALWTLPHTVTALVAHLFSSSARGNVSTYNAFLGAVALAGVPAGWADARVRRLALPLVASFALALLLCPPTAPRHVLPVAPNSYYATPLLVAALVLLGGAGLTRALACEPRARAGLAATACLTAAAAGLLAWLAPTSGAGGYGAFLATALATAAIVCWRAKPAGLVLAAVAALELGVAARTALPPLPPCPYPITPVVSWLQAHAKGWRVGGDGVALLPNLAPMYGLESIDLSDPFQQKRYAAFDRALHPDLPPFPWQTTLRPPFQAALLDLANVRYVVAALPPMREQLDFERYPRVLVAGQVIVYGNPRALPRARVVYAADWCDPARAAAVLASYATRYRTRALLEGPPAPGWQDAELPPTPATLERPNPNEVRVVAHAARPGYLVLAETYAAGWQAEVDGRPAPVLPVDVAFRAVALPPGDHRVTFRYRPPAVGAGLALSLLALAIWLGLWWRGRAPSVQALGPTK